MTRLFLRFLMFSFVVVTALAAISCDDGDADPTPAASGPTDSPVPTQAANQEAIAAAREYLVETGVDGNEGDFTDPLNCAGITNDSPGRFCVHDGFTVYAPGLVILYIGDKDDPAEETWEIRLEPGESAWEVTSAEPFGSNE